MRLDDVFQQTHKLPAMPRVAQALIDSFSAENVDVDDLITQISHDQVITAKVLRLANSAAFGASRRVGSVGDALVVLGFNTMRTLVVASAVTGAFVLIPGLDRRRFWRESLCVATYCQWLADISHSPGGLAFSTGLMHNIGELLLHLAAPEAIAKTDKQLPAGPERAQQQRAVLGVDYVQAGEELARRWNFPEELRAAIRYQHDPEAQPHPLADILHSALALSAAVAKAGADESGITAALNAMPPESAARLHIPPAQLTSSLPQLQARLSDLEELLL
ncbi:HDOD domain-containing protein [Amantichitinum ursilacus]|uniref:HDOD domain protein n=1 Tax=Amantichitinum ursilacus TaxID=857265 RepID=A0A0N1JS87_9NEIS|nr:HDOD domain-containing protein [Amantichitinum ursilacus]KPC51616.1 HDOD domain protein [Amantichitinum ursilacus]